MTQAGPDERSSLVRVRSAPMTRTREPNEIEWNGVLPTRAEEAGFDPVRLVRLGGALSAMVQAGRLAGASVLVSRRGTVVCRFATGAADRERGVSFDADTLVRIYSMTKPVVSAVLLSLFEEGRFGLDDPVGDYLPAFAEPRVVDDPAGDPTHSHPAKRQLTVRHLLTHTAGLTYGFLGERPLDAAYVHARLEPGAFPGDLAGFVDELATMPLLFEPGTAWNYSVATDVVGRLAEVLGGASLDQLVATRLTGPLGMANTAFHVPGGEGERLAACYQWRDGALAKLESGPGSRWCRPPGVLSGGGGLVSTLDDYHRFARALCAGGTLDGASVLGRRTVGLMTANHLPGGRDVAEMGRPDFNGPMAGYGFGLGPAVFVDPVAAGTPVSPGTWTWGGAASTTFFVDPAEEIVGILLTQLVPSSTWPLARLLQVLTYGALLR